MELWRIPVSGTVISDPVQLFDVSKNIKNAGSVIARASSTDGVSYSATVPGVTELYAGLEITIIPEMVSASTTIMLDVNGLGAKHVRLPLSSNTSTLVQPDAENFFVDNHPVKLMYDPEFVGKGAWVAICKQRQNGTDLYGSVVTAAYANLMVADWSEEEPFQQTVEVEGVTTKNHVFVSPAPARFAQYLESGIYCTKQAAGTLTFQCEVKPTGIIPVNVLIFN